MLILPPGHAQTVRVTRRLTPREKWILGGVSGVVAALVVVVAISLLSASHKSANGCVDVTLPYITGAQELYRCGPAAQEMCKSVGVTGGYTGAAGQAVAAQCRKAGLVVGP